MSRPRVLIVEDDSDIRRLYALGLNQRGFEVKLASNGAEAVDRILAGERPDVILLDWLLPLMDGGEVLSRLRDDQRGARIPIIVISGQPAPPEDEMDPRIQCWMTKPVTIEELVSEIQRPPGGRRSTKLESRVNGENLLRRP
jgi:two-component system phosphate regulon response regulator PhoB